MADTLALALIGLGIAAPFIALYATVYTGPRVKGLGLLVYKDDGQAENLFSETGKVYGKPDMVVKPFLRRHRPVEVKSHELRGDKPRTSHVVQLMAQGLVVEATWGRYPTMGYLLYKGRDPIPVKLGRGARRRVLALRAAMRSERPFPTQVELNMRCQACPVRGDCRLQTP
jgi:CRISPR/Cas system-associated exonuclease Cas4 (RecB family)